MGETLDNLKLHMGLAIFFDHCNSRLEGQYDSIDQLAMPSSM